MFSGTLKSFKPFFFCFKNLRCTDFFDDTRFRQQSMHLVVNTGQNEIAVLMGEAFIDFDRCAATVTSIPWACHLKMSTFILELELTLRWHFQLTHRPKK